MTKKAYRNLALGFYLSFLVFYIIAIIARFFIQLTIYNVGIDNQPYNFVVTNQIFSFFSYFVFAFLLWMLIWSANKQMISTRNILNLTIWFLYPIYLTLLFFALFLNSLGLSISLLVLLLFLFTLIVWKFVQVKFNEDRKWNIFLVVWLVLYLVSELFALFLPLIGVQLLTLIYLPFVWLILIVFIYLLVIKALKHYKS